MPESPPEEILNQGWESLRQEGVQPLLHDLYESLITASRRMAEALAPEDIFELEHGTALAEFGDGGKVLAGGQSLLPMMNFRLARPEALVDIGGLCAGAEGHPGQQAEGNLFAHHVSSSLCVFLPRT